MQKSLYALLTITLVFISLIAGVFIGRNSIGAQVTLDPASGNVLDPSSTGSKSEELGKVNINTAQIYELTLLPGIGESKAKAIIAFREEYGRFTRVDDLIYVDGFSYVTIEQLRPYITVGG